MTSANISIQVEGFDAADSVEGAKSLRQFIVHRSVEKDISGIQIEMAHSDPSAQPAMGDVLQISLEAAHVGVLTGVFLVETIKLWHETRRDKALIVVSEKGSRIRVEVTNPDGPKVLEQAIMGSAPRS